MRYVIELNNVHVIFGHKCVLDVESLRIAPEERVFVLGRSGSGKTTLSRLLKGRLEPSSGEIRVLGANPASHDPIEMRIFQRKIAMIDQEFFLVPRLSVIENVLNGCLGRVSSMKSLLGLYPKKEWQKAEAILQEVELEGLGNRSVETLSGGQKQRTAIARALMQEAEIILADEPISNLDPGLGEDALKLLVECLERRGVTLICNLHQPALARQFASRFIGLSNGRVVYDGSPEGLEEYGTEFVYRNGDNGHKEKTKEPEKTPSNGDNITRLQKK